MNRTGYQAVSPSYWPIMAAVSLMGVFKSLLMCVCNSSSGVFWWVFLVSFSLFCYTAFNWWWDMVAESQHKGEWSRYEVRLHSWGFRFFIISEIFFFISLLGSYVYFGVGEMSVHGVGFWPPRGVKPLHPMKGALTCTGLLVWSSFSVSWAFKAVEAHNKVYISVNSFSNTGKVSGSALSHKMIDQSEGGSLGVEGLWNSLMEGIKGGWDNHLVESMVAYVVTILAGMRFTYLQAQEYLWASYCMSDGVFGSVFYLLTGFHGLHVIAGNIFLLVTLCRLCFFHFSYKNFYVGVWASGWYWHLVDVVWVFLYGMVYLWGFWGYF